MESKVLKPICEIAPEIKDGDWIESKDQSTSGIRLIQTGNIGNGEYLDKESRAKYISEDTFEELKCSEVFPGDILISRLPDPVGRSCVIPKGLGKMVTAVDCSIVRLDSKLIDPEYFIQFTNSNNYQKQISQFLTGTTRKRISRKNLEQIKVPTPTLEIQIIQSKILGTIDTLIKKLAKLNTLFDRLVRSRFIEVFGDPATNPFGWETVKLKDVCDSVVRGPFGSSLKKEFFVPKSNGTFKVYEQKNAIQKSDKLGSYYITKKKFEELKRFECKPGDIIMSCSGTMGELYQLPENSEPGLINQALCKFTLNKRILPDVFLTYMRETIGNLSSHGSGIKNIAAVTFVKDLPVNLPPLEVQNTFSEFLSQTDKSKFLQN